MSKNPSINEKVAKEQALQDLKQQYHDQGVESSHLKTAFNKSSDQLHLRRQEFSCNQGKLEEWQVDELKKLEQNRKESEQALVAAENEREETNRKIAEADKALRELSFQVGLSEVRNHFDAIGVIQEEAKRTKQLMDARQQIIDQANSIKDPMPPLYKQREDLMAKWVKGEATDQQVEEMEEEIQKTGSTFNKESAIAEREANREEAAIAGLGRIAEEATERLKQLQDQTPDLINGYLMTEAEKTGKLYAKAVTQTIKQFEKIVAINELINRHGTSRRNALVGNHRSDLVIPSFNINTLKEQSTMNGIRLELYNSTSTVSSTNSNEQMAAILDELNQHGVDLT